MAAAAYRSRVVPLARNGCRPWARARNQFIIQSHVANWYEARRLLNSTPPPQYWTLVRYVNVTTKYYGIIICCIMNLRCYYSFYVLIIFKENVILI